MRIPHTVVRVFIGLLVAVEIFLAGAITLDAVISPIPSDQSGTLMVKAGIALIVMLGLLWCISFQQRRRMHELGKDGPDDASWIYLKSKARAGFFAAATVLPLYLGCCMTQYVIHEELLRRYGWPIELLAVASFGIILPLGWELLKMWREAKA